MSKKIEITGKPFFHLSNRTPLYITTDGGHKTIEKVIEKELRGEVPIVYKDFFEDGDTTKMLYNEGYNHLIKVGKFFKFKLKEIEPKLNKKIKITIEIIDDEI